MKYFIYSKKVPFSLSHFFGRYEDLSRESVHHVFLESGRGGKFSIAAFQPETVFIGKNGELKIVQQQNTSVEMGNPLERLKEWLNRHQVERRGDLPDFQGGAVGYISYDYGRYIERLPALAADDLQMPDIYFLLFHEWFVYDHADRSLSIMILHEPGQEALAEAKAEEWAKAWLEPIKTKEDASRNSTNMANREFSFSEAGFVEAVEKVRDYITEGDTFQVNLSVRQSSSLHVPAIDVYKELRALNPSPYMGYFHTPDFQLVSGSPELLIKKKGTEVSTRPIAGTRSRGQNDLDDLKLANELIENEKERAEHVMLVDLERNDLGRVCEFGTVVVDEFMVIEKYSHVMHIVSNVKGQLAEGNDWFDLINAVFPGGTITGAPKVRTMEIIAELEPVTRGPYTGSLGWVGFNGDTEMNIMIRTMLVKEGKAHVQAGAGIVIDSVPKQEYKESLKKAAALWKAKELAEAGKGVKQ